MNAKQEEQVQKYIEGLLVQGDAALRRAEAAEERERKALRLSLELLGELAADREQPELHGWSEELADQLYAARFLPDRDLCSWVKHALDNCVPDYCTRLLALLDGDHFAWWQNKPGGGVKHSSAPGRDGGE